MENNVITQNIDADLELINKLTRRPLKAEEVYTFNVVLCDNDLDRDFEVFDLKCLYELKELFLGKTGIFDHDPKGSNQTSRIFFTEVVRDPIKKTKLGQDYYMLKAKAYMIRNEKNKDLIEEIDGGIKKEVSIGCSVSCVKCSICGCNTKKEKCEHVLGNRYIVNGEEQLCYHVLESANDAYEWPFVAVPAQRQAGVVKSIRKKFTDSYETNNFGNEDRTQLDKYLEYISQLESVIGEFEEELRSQVKKSFAVLQPELKLSTIKSMIEKLNIAELKELKKVQDEKMGKNVIIQAEGLEASKDADLTKFSI